MKPYLTKVWIGNRWWYLDTNRRYKLWQGRIFWVKIGIVSYKHVEEGSWDS